MRTAYCCFLLLTANLLLASAEKEFPIPQELIDRLSHSEVRSISDLQRLLQEPPAGPGNEVIEEEVQQKNHHPFHPGSSDLQKNHQRNHHSSHPGSSDPQKNHHPSQPGSSDLKSHQMSHRRKRSVVEEAVPAMCKTRTVVYEIPRSQVDPTSANFLIWPACVEVKRCTGCCNTGNMRCHASKKHHRTVKVAKVEFASRKKAKLKEVLIRLEDHVECVCTSQHHVPDHVEADAVDMR